MNLQLSVTREGGGRCLQGNLCYSPPATMTSRLASVTFRMASKVFIKETDENFDFTTEILFRFLGFGDFNPIQTGVGGGGGFSNSPSGKIVVTPTPKEL